MYLDALSFLEDEREAWRAYEALDELTDEDLSRPVEGAHGWSGRDLVGHLVGWHELTVQVVKELAVGETSPTQRRIDAEWDKSGAAMNDDIQREWAALPMDEVRRRFRTVPGELRGYLTVVPEVRWLKHPSHMESILDVTLDHYAEHEDDLAAILGAAR